MHFASVSVMDALASMSGRPKLSKVRLPISNDFDVAYYWTNQEKNILLLYDMKWPERRVETP
jgi:hypothetical protein